MTQADPFAQFKERQREGWSHFAPIEVFTAPPAARLVRFAGIAPGANVLDVATGTGVVAVTAARSGAKVTGLDLTPALLEHARHNARLAEQAEIRFVEGDIEALPFEDASFDVVVSQFGHIFAPRADVALREMLRVLRPGGTIAFATWPPEQFVGRFFTMAARFMPPPAGAAVPAAWGDVAVVSERMGDAVRDLAFDRAIMHINALSIGHFIAMLEETVAPARALVRGDADVLARFRAELGVLGAEYFDDNQVRQDYLLTRATKK